jgi:glycosidase
MKKYIIAALLFVTSASNGQILNVEPAFPTKNDIITLTYDASEGNGALIGLSPIYAHTGVIVNGDALTNWQLVQGTWGTADASVAMNNLGSNLHQISIDIDQFYSVPASTEISHLAFVFRNSSGSVVGRSADGNDIYYPIYPENAGLLTKFFTPESIQILNIGETFNVKAKTNQTATMSLFEDGQLISSINGTTELNVDITASSFGNHELIVVSENGSLTSSDTIHYVVNPPVTNIDPPSGMLTGLNRIDENTILLTLFAPQKEHVFVIGDFNNWSPDTTFHMKRSADGKTWWLKIDGLLPGVTYGYQYLIDGTLKLADPLSERIADPNNDNSIPIQTNPNPYSYPVNQTSGFITLFETKPYNFNWIHDHVSMPPKENLMIYELLVRDFVSKRNYLTIIDTLDYLDSLGINAIELMPVNEFENNDSWGYNPSFHMALDKYYGTPEHFKAFVDACHERGIAVIMDIALNHTFGQSPMVNMYWDAVNNRPAANNPWFNATCPHPPFCWGYDLNHEVQPTKDYVDRILAYWIKEYHIDGYRLDYTKGFVNNGNDFSTTRIAILKRLADSIWSVKPDTYIILEHWANNQEETDLANYGMLLWGNLTYEFHQAMKGYSSNLSWGIHTSRGWSKPHLVSYIESHDEERGLFECLEFGNQSNPEHNPRELTIAMKRSEAAAVTLLTIPGPKMIWQFGELGYDISIDVPCRVCPKPILWQYFNNVYRRNLYNVYKSLLYLRENYPTFNSDDFSFSMNSSFKKITLNHPEMNAVVFSHFGLDTANAIAGFPETGTWYEYYSGDSLVVSNVNMQISLEPAGYRIYTTKPLKKPAYQSTVGLQELIDQSEELSLYPNPTNDHIQLDMRGNLSNSWYMITDLSGKTIQLGSVPSDKKIHLTELLSGTYIILVEKENKIYHNKIIVNK